MIKLYTIGCGKCVILEKRLNESGVNYRVCEDRDEMERKGFDFMPVLEVDGECMNFSEAMRWVDRNGRR